MSSVENSAPTFEQEARGHCWRGARLAFVLGVVLLPGFMLLDRAIFPTHAEEFRIWRLASAGLLVVLGGLLYHPFGRRWPEIPGFIGGFISAAMIDLMVYRTGGGGSPYYAGLSLVLIVCGFVYPWSWRWSVGFSVSVIGSYMLTVLASDSFGNEKIFFNNLFFLFSTAGVVAAGSVVGERLRRREFEAKRAAEDASLAKGQFLANMSHEIRTPMNAVIGMTRLLNETELSREQRDYVDTIRGGGESLLTIINDILDYSKIEAGKMELERIAFEVREVLGDALDLLAQRAGERGIELACQFDGDVPGEVVGDPTRVRQVLVNLLSNAVKFTEQGEVVVRVSARDIDAGTELHFAVRDTGIGIPPDRIPLLFDSFQQVDAQTTRKFGGTGLGLAISKRFSVLMGGTMWVESEVGRGSVFHFTMVAPALRAPAVDEPGDSRLESLRVLLVDDNRTNLRILERQVSGWGMEVVATTSPREALDRVSGGERFDAAVLDLVMPDLDGVELAAALGKTPAGKALPLVLLSSMQPGADAGETGDFAAMLMKPVRPAHLLEALECAVRGVERPSETDDGPRIDATLADRVPLRILLVEDNRINQRVALGILGRMGYEAEVANNGLEALEALEASSYDVVLMDMQMPEMDGVEATRQARHRVDRIGRPRIIAMTANASEADRSLCIEVGMDDFLAKPVSPEKLATALERSASAGGAEERRSQPAEITASPGPIS